MTNSTPQNTMLKMFEQSIQRVDDFARTALQQWTRSGNGNRHLVGLINVAAVNFAHCIELNGTTVTVYRCPIQNYPVGPSFKAELSDGATQSEMNEIVIDLLRKSLGPAEAFMLFDQPRH